MKDAIGIFLMNWRISAVFPLINGYLLDVGCGTNQLVKRYGNGVGVDVYPWENVDLLVDDTSKLPVEDETFDTITVIAALNHIPNRREVLYEINRVMKKDGLLIITMINPIISRIWHFLRRPWDADQNERGIKDGEVYGFTRQDLKILLKSANFEIIAEKPFMLYLNRVICAKKLDL
jgi:SAM-dependent methyltransferase